MKNFLPINYDGHGSINLITSLIVMATIRDYFTLVSSRVPLETEVETGSTHSSDSPLNSDSEETEESSVCHIVSPAVDVDCLCPCCSSTSSDSSCASPT